MPMLNDFLQHKIYIEINTVDGESLTALEEILGGKEWAHGERLNGTFSRQRLNDFICHTDGKIYFDDTRERIKAPIVKLTDFIEVCSPTGIQINDLDATEVFEGKYGT